MKWLGGALFIAGIVVNAFTPPARFQFRRMPWAEGYERVTEFMILCDPGPLWDVYLSFLLEDTDHHQCQCFGAYAKTRGNEPRHHPLWIAVVAPLNDNGDDDDDDRAKGQRQLLRSLVPHPFRSRDTHGACAHHAVVLRELEVCLGRRLHVDTTQHSQHYDT